MRTVKIARVQVGVNEDGVPMFGPASQAPDGFVSVEITSTEYIYTYA